MKAHQLLSHIETITAVRNEIEYGFNQEELDEVQLEHLDSAVMDLRLMLSKKLATIEDNNDVTSSKISYEKMTVNDWIQFHMNNVIPKDEMELMIARMNSNSNFTYPMLELFPGDGKFTEHAVAGEPLYIVDYHEELLEFASKRFNPFYSNRRLMKYVVSDFNLDQLPKEQVGMAFCYNIFFSKNISFIASWAQAVLSILRPGGYFLFNFIPNNTSWGVKLSEENRLTCIDQGRLSQMLINMGYELVSVDLRPSYASTILVKRPGELRSFKLSSAVAKIIDKSDPLV